MSQRFDPSWPAPIGCVSPLALNLMLTPASAHDESTLPRRRRLSHLVYSLSVIVVVGVVAALAYLVWYDEATGELESEVARILERDEPLWYSDLRPATPIPQDDDATPLFLAAVAKLKAQPETFYELLDAEPPMNPAWRDLVATAIEDNQSALELLREAIRKPRFRLPVDYDSMRPNEESLFALQRSREFARLLDAEVIHAIGSGDEPRAVAAMHDAFTLAELTRDEPFLIAQWIRFAVTVHPVGTSFGSGWPVRWARIV